MKLDGKQDFCNDFWRNSSFAIVTLVILDGRKILRITMVYVKTNRKT